MLKELLYPLRYVSTADTDVAVPLSFHAEASHDLFKTLAHYF